MLAFDTESDRGESRLSSFPSAPTVQTPSLTAFLLVLLSFVRVCEGARSIAEVLAEPTDVTPSQGDPITAALKSHFAPVPRAAWKFPPGSGEVKSGKRKMDDFQARRRCFSPLLSSPSPGCSSARKSSQRAQLSIQAKNTRPHALWNTLPLFTCPNPS